MWSSQKSPDACCYSCKLFLHHRFIVQFVQCLRGCLTLLSKLVTLCFKVLLLIKLKAVLNNYLSVGCSNVTLNLYPLCLVVTTTGSLLKIWCNICAVGRGDCLASVYKCRKTRSFYIQTNPQAFPDLVIESILFIVGAEACC